ncbi:Clp protease [Mumia sp. ZJ1417]|uniref:Clp protease N-terminal domain-containing protein n=1 Tax=Mumia sp. ZJ1417 TaxID=2708082 RepID=UPI00141F9F5A|nr:Clp protease N-terminal domain-containing protein [Mumia sp. ZJ1417]QMW67110.1 Clp protease [Mumia sp. ZJ1417]
MFEKFTSTARSAVVDAQVEAHDVGDRRIEPVHVLGALAKQEPADGALARHGVTYEALRAEIARSGAGALDAEALAALGVDVDAVRERAETTFGAGALERAGRGHGHLRFTRQSKAVLEQALRVTVAGPGREIGASQLLAGVLAVDDVRTATVIAAVCDDPAALRADVVRLVSGGA